MSAVEVTAVAAVAAMQLHSCDRNRQVQHFHDPGSKVYQTHQGPLGSRNDLSIEETYRPEDIHTFPDAFRKGWGGCNNSATSLSQCC